MVDKSVTDAGDAAQVQQKVKKYKSRALIEREELKALLREIAFRRFVWRLLGECGIGNDAYLGDVNDMLINSGKRHIGMRLIHYLDEVDETAYPKMMLENIGKDDDG
ncbi:MAG: hypothetical protein V3V96_15375 [Acidiferrobacterales bacterium]